MTDNDFVRRFTMKNGRWIEIDKNSSPIQMEEKNRRQEMITTNLFPLGIPPYVTNSRRGYFKLEHSPSQQGHEGQNKGNKMKIELNNYNSSTYLDGSMYATMDITFLEWEFTLFGIEERYELDEGRSFMYPNSGGKPWMAFDSLEINKQFFKEVEIAVDNLLGKRPLEPTKKGKHYDTHNKLQSD